MVKRWKDEIILGLVLLACSMFGGYCGAKMAQIYTPKPPATYERFDTFGSYEAEGQAPVIVIVVNDSATLQRSLNSIHRPVNFI